jgi:hypothetical protein
MEIIHLFSFIRMINRIGTKSTDDYVEYLQKREGEGDEDSQAERLSYDELKKEIGVSFRFPSSL